MTVSNLVDMLMESSSLTVQMPSHQDKWEVTVALIKRTPAKVSHRFYKTFCPSCDRQLTNEKFCPDCGQKIDWSDDR